MRDLLLPLSIFALAGAMVWAHIPDANAHGEEAMPPAPRTECQEFPDSDRDAIAAFITTQRAKQTSGFVAYPIQPVAISDTARIVICAW